MIRRPPRSPLFPYTTLSRSAVALPLLAARLLGWQEPGARAVIVAVAAAIAAVPLVVMVARVRRDLKSTRLNSSHDQISYAVFCLKKKKNHLAVQVRQQSDAE